MDDRRRQPHLPSRRAAGRRAGRGVGLLSRRRRPERLPGLVDSHCHLQHDSFDADRDEVLERAVAAGIERILVPGYDLASSEAALDLARRHDGLIHAAVGIHPHYAAEADEPTWARLESLATDPRCVAIGEIGLDFYRNLAPAAVQRQVFARQLDMAERTGRPVLVHDRDAHRVVTDMLLAWHGPVGRPLKGILHCFSGDRLMATQLADAGYLVSFALPVSFASAVGPRAAAVALPEDSILVETDSPYLGPAAERRNEPTTALRVAAELARLRGTSPETITAKARSAYDRLIAG